MKYQLSTWILWLIILLMAMVGLLTLFLLALNIETCLLNCLLSFVKQNKTKQKQNKILSNFECQRDDIIPAPVESMIWLMPMEPSRECKMSQYFSPTDNMMEVSYRA